MLNTSAEIRERYQKALQVCLAELTLHAQGQELGWTQLDNAVRSAANATIICHASPMTPRRQMAQNVRNNALFRTRREPGDAFAADLLRQADLGARAAVRQHEEESMAAFMASVEDNPPPRRLSVLYRYLRKGKRAANQTAGGPSMREWEDEVLRLAEGERPDYAAEGGQPRDAPPPPTAVQLQQYASHLTRRTAPGLDGIPNELLIHAPYEFYELLEPCVAAMWRANRFPTLWTESTQCPIPKKARARRVDEFRLIALCCGAYKLLARHLLILLSARLPELDIYQAGFQAGRSTYDNIFILRRILDENWRAGRPLYVLSLDLKQAFPSMSLRAIAEILIEEGIPPYLVNRVIALALTDRTHIRWGRARTATVIRGRGIRQGCPVSPWLFTIILHWAIRRISQRFPRLKLGLTAAGLLPALLAYADDLILVVRDLEDAALFVTLLVEELRRLTMELNFNKSELLYREPGAEVVNPLGQVQVGPYQFQQVQRLEYLGALITDGLHRQLIAHHRINRAKRSVAAILPTLHRHPLPPAVIFRVYRTVVLPALSYELATTASTKRARESLRREANILLKAMLASARRPRVGVPRIARLGRRKGSIVKAVRSARIHFAGHTMRRPEGHVLQRARDLDLRRRKVGRPCFTFNTSLEEDLSRIPAPEEGWVEVMLDKAQLTKHLKEVMPDCPSSGGEDTDLDEEESLQGASSDGDD